MGLLNSALQIGRSALLSYQSALPVVGSNVSSAGSPDYTRLTPELDPLAGVVGGYGLQPGAGVALTGIQRVIDNALEGRVRMAVGDAQAASTRRSLITQVESAFNDLDNTGIAGRLSTFFNSFDDLANNPEDQAVRGLAVSAGVQLSEGLRSLRSQLVQFGTDMDNQISLQVSNANEIAAGIAKLNERIATHEAGASGEASGLRDQRDAMLRDLGTIALVTVREQTDGGINVYLGSEALVQGNRSRGLQAVTNIDGQFQRTTIRFADTGGEVSITGGSLGGTIAARDEHAYAYIERLDELAAGVIEEVNRIHADGQGLVGFASVVGSSQVLAGDAALDSAQAGLNQPVTNGSFFITVADNATSTPVAHRIEVDLTGGAADTTLDSLVADTNATVSGVTASVTSDNRLSLVADDGFSFTVGHDGQQGRADTSGVLAALGINTFFVGSSAKDIAINATLEAAPELLAASSAFLPGDGANAGRLAALDSGTSARLSGMSITGYYGSVAFSVAASAAQVEDEVQATSSVLAALQSQRESLSGVNLDEEAISLMKYQRAFQGAARYLSVVDDLIQEMLAIVR